ncbi:hypothetical protein AMTR_s00078p00175340 [Amborella trichopoda]|uniref:Uncharacterized protein n=1 Tax=Amborella trichopoda TaxID=13333 RepID=W1P211_AMBTC|nr:hypothetical protein AMTR_s00078p00175340 [Amborella trichopoda]
MSLNVNYLGNSDHIPLPRLKGCPSLVSPHSHELQPGTSNSSLHDEVSLRGPGDGEVCRNRGSLLLHQSHLIFLPIIPQSRKMTWVQ